MRLLKLTCPVLVWILSGLSASFGLVKEDSILVRWNFDTGEGNIAHPVPDVGVPALLSNEASWGSEANGTALSKHSLDISDGLGFAVAEHNARLDVGFKFSLLMWFKPNGTPSLSANLSTKQMV